MDFLDQIEFTIQYRDIADGNNFVLGSRIVANLSAVDYLKNFNF